MESRNNSHGSVIALEGSSDTVSTQLRLLPTSSQLLVLPSLQDYMGKASGGPFHARSLIKRVHDAAQKRHDAAAQFIQDASPTNKRLVFLNGGTAGAVSHCITAISENQTSGDIHEAELMFRNIALEGLRGLDREDKYSDQATLWMLGREQTSCALLLDSEEPEDDPITKAMRAADLLYKETDSLQPIDCYIRSRPRSLSVPMYGYSDGMGEPSPFFVFGSAPHEEPRLRPDVGGDEAGEHRGMAEHEFAKLCAIKIQTDTSGEDLPVPGHAASCGGESYSPLIAEARPWTRRSDALLSPPASPEGVVYGEARLVQMRTSKTQVTLRETRSLDDLELEQTRRRRTELDLVSTTKQVLPFADNPEAKSRHLSIAEKPYPADTPLHLPQARFVKAHTTTIRRSPTFARRLPKPARHSYVHRGTDAVDLEEEKHELDEPFQPVLPVFEDLVIHMTGQTPDVILGMVVRFFKAGAFPVVPFPALLQTAPTDSCPSTPRTADLFDLEQDVDAGLSPVVEHPGAEEIGEYDPFAVRGRNVRASSLALQPPSPPPPAGVPPDSRQPPIPAPLSSPIQRERESRFHEFSTAGRSNAVATQNALRSVLEVYFPPPGDGCFQRFDFPMSRDIGRLWQPMFGGQQVRNGNGEENAPDVILAVGRQNGVGREFMSALIGRVEKLGTKSSGMSRSGRLDLRYLIATAMQSLAAQPPAQQPQSSPLEDAFVLAGLIIPHLETYLAANYGTRFLLLEYPAEHLATALALQKLVGTKVFKVAGIIDSEATSPSPSGVSSPVSSRHSSHSAAPFSNTASNGLDSFNLPGSPFPDEREKTRMSQQRKCSFSEANYLLTSSASEPEISVFIATILKDLTDIDPFYMPEASSPPAARPGTAKSTKSTAGGAPGLPTLMSKFTLQGPNGSPAYTHTAVFGPPANLPVSPPYTNDGDGGSGRSTPRVVTAPGDVLAAHNFPFPPPPAPRSPSPAPSAASSRSRGLAGGHSARARSLTRPRLGKLGNDSGPDDGSSMYAVSVVEDGEFYDEEEKRLMPLYMRQSELRKGNSRKALKWLGLA